MNIYNRKLRVRLHREEREEEESFLQCLIARRLAAHHAIASTGGDEKTHLLSPL